jgi:transcription initiation factor IIE alpha subunit
VKGVSAIKHIWLRMSYRCCGMEWTDEWPAALKLECPECGEMVEAYDVAELRPRRGKTPEPLRAREPEAVGEE